MTSSKNRPAKDANEIVSSLLDMAANVEHASAGFYLQASRNVSDREARRTLQELAATELQHKNFFSDMKQQFQDSIEGPIEQSAWQSISRYAKTVRDTRIFDFDYMLSHKVTGKEKKEDVTQMAIAFEKDSIIFYTGLANIIENNELNKLLKEIIREEFNHLSALSNIVFL